MPQHLPAPLFTIAGTLWLPDPDHPGRQIRKVAQLTAYGKGNVPGSPHRRQQIRAHVIPYDPATPAQLACRARFADAMNAWHTTDDTTQRDWTNRAKRLKIGGMHLFIRKWIATH
jgi:hypothetical protein